MQQKRYLENLVALCSEHSFGQDAIEWAILLGHVTPGYTDLEADVRLIMGDVGRVPSRGAPGQATRPTAGSTYDSLCENYHRHQEQMHAQIWESYEQSGLLAELNRSQPLAA